MRKRFRNKNGEVSSEKIFKLKEMFGYEDKSVAILLKVGVSQLQHYKARGTVPLDRWTGLKDGLRLKIREDADRLLHMVDSL